MPGAMHVSELNSISPTIIGRLLSEVIGEQHILQTLLVYLIAAQTID
jgi:hypothetical protein